MGHGKLATYTIAQIMNITEFINTYPRKKFNGKSSAEIFEELKRQSPTYSKDNETCN